MAARQRQTSVLTSAVSCAGIAIRGRLDSTANQILHVEFFTSSACARRFRRGGGVPRLDQRGYQRDRQCELQRHTRCRGSRRAVDHRDGRSRNNTRILRVQVGRGARPGGNRGDGYATAQALGMSFRTAGRIRDRWLRGSTTVTTLAQYGEGPGEAPDRERAVHLALESRYGTVTYIAHCARQSSARCATIDSRERAKRATIASLGRDGGRRHQA